MNLDYLSYCCPPLASLKACFYIDYKFLRFLKNNNKQSDVFSLSALSLSKLSALLLLFILFAWWLLFASYVLPALWLLFSLYVSFVL